MAVTNKALGHGQIDVSDRSWLVGRNILPVEYS